MTGKPVRPADVRPLSPGEFSAFIGDVRTPEWVREEIRAGRIRTVDHPNAPRKPYLIPRSELARFMPLEVSA